MRWLLLGLPSGLLLALVVYLSRPEAAPETIHDIRVPDDKKSTVSDPVAFLEECLHHYDKAVKGYSLVMYKQERIGGRSRRHRYPPLEQLIHRADGHADAQHDHKEPLPALQRAGSQEHFARNHRRHQPLHEMSHAVEMIAAELDTEKNSSVQ